MKGLSSLVPVAVGIVIICAVTSFLLTNGWAAGPWLLALLLFAHGWVHLVFLFPQPQPAAAASNGLAYPFDMGRSWLISRRGFDAGRVRVAGIVMMTIVFAASLLAALATVGLVVPTSWWSGLVVVSALSSMVMLTAFFAPALLLGYAIDLALLWLVFGSVWSPVATP